MSQAKLTGRIFYIIAFLFLGIAAFSSFQYHGDAKSILSYSYIILPITHIICCALSLICVIKPIFPLNFIICFVESVLTILTASEILGAFLFYAGIVIFCLNGPITLSKKIALAIFFVIHIISIVLSYTHGWVITLLAFFSSVFMLSFMIWIYAILKERLSCFLPTNVSQNKIVGEKQPGSELHLMDYGLTERQINLVMDYVYHNLSYKALSEKYAMSLSLVKKEFNEVFQIFKVSKIEELYILLLQYQLKR